MNTKETPFISSPPDEIVKENTAFEVITNNFAGSVARILSSPARQMPGDLSHLKHQGVMVML